MGVVLFLKGALARACLYFFLMYPSRECPLIKERGLPLTLAPPMAAPAPSTARMPRASASRLFLSSTRFSSSSSCCSSCEKKNIEDAMMSKKKKKKTSTHNGHNGIKKQGGTLIGGRHTNHNQVKVLRVRKRRHYCTKKNALGLTASWCLIKTSNIDILFYARRP